MCAFLLERQKRRTSTVSDLRRYRQVLWLSSLPQHPAVASTLWGDKNVDEWVSVDRVEYGPPPRPPAELVGRLEPQSLTDWEGAEPRLLPDDQSSSHGNLRVRYPRWFSEWRDWAEEQRLCARVIETYARLYGIYQDVQVNAEEYELVLCVGYLTGQSGSREVRRHLLTTPAAIHLDSTTGRLTVTIGQDGGGLRLEQEMLDSSDARAGHDETVKSLLEAAEDDPFSSQTREALRAWTIAHGPSTLYLDQDEPHANPPHEIRVSFAPALVLRERTRRSYVEAFTALEKLVREGGHVPEALRVLVAPQSAEPEAETEASAAPATAELYFPAPSNQEQRRIAERLRRDTVVVVQGPPGTGKTHTIANLITDLLAHGKRVLVTSHTARALEEVRDKLPVEVQDLCVSMAAEHGRGQRELEQSVQTLLDRLDRYDERQSRSERTRLEKRLADARSARAKASNRLREIREGESFQYSPTYGDYEGTAAVIADRLVREKDELGWLGPVPGKRPKITAEDALRFLTLLRQVTPEVRQLAGRVPEADQLTQPEQFASLAERHARHEADVVGERQVRESPQYRWLATLSAEQRVHVAGLLAAVGAGLSKVDRVGDRLADAVDAAWRGSYRTWQDRRDLAASALDRVRGNLAQVEGHQVTGLADGDVEIMFNQVCDLRERLSRGKKLTGPLGLKSRPLRNARSLVDQVRVDGARLDRRPELVDVLWAWLATDIELRGIERELGLPAAGSPTVRAARLADEYDALALVVDLGDALAALASGSNAPFPWLPQSVDVARGALRALALDDLREETARSVEPTRRALQSALGRTDCAPSVADALNALNAWDSDRYADAYRQMEGVRQANALLSDLAQARAVVAAAHPDLALRIEADPYSPEWDQRLARLVDAWNWSVWDAEIRDLADPQGERQLLGALDQAERDEWQALRELAANRAWDHCLRRMSQRDRLHLNGYVSEIKRIGKGKGKYVNRHRAYARRHLQQCQHAVPAWIMPLYRVADSIPMDEPNPFDVVIIDEASQSGPEAMLLLWLGKQIVVVGDDQQVSPEEVGQERGEVQQLIETYLRDMPAASLFQVGSSFFDLAKASGRTIKLLEHFRCMPEIIAFSNRECYGGELRPLRQYGRDRLEPLRHTYVEGAYVIGEKNAVRNEVEADALVEQIVRCCEDPAYAGRTMGVITLQGNAQQKLIQDKLMLRLPVSEIEKRSLRVGNPESFQGAERDVIFLSMVTAVEGEHGTRRIQAQTRADALRRFNVAASRARDQVWLFHSVRLADLSEADLRHKYLEFVSRPPAEQDEIELASVPKDYRVPPFDSLFEQRVYLDLRARGYRVRPQYRALGYYIDLVVEGGTSRLAIECDGDAYHGPDRADHDGARQRDLERIGWTVWRVRASTYTYDPVAALEPLWELLDQHGIHPLDARPATPVTAPPDSAGQDAAPAAEPPPRPQPATGADTRARIRENEREPSAPRSSARRNATPAADRVNPVPVDGPDKSVRRRPGQVDLPRAAFERLRQEQALLRARLAERPAIAAVDRAALQAQQHDHELTRQRLSARLSELDRILDNAVVRPRRIRSAHPYPGCLFHVRDALTNERYFVTLAEAVDEASGYEAVTPDSAMGRALAEATTGSSVTFTTPAGKRTVHILSIRSELPHSID